MPSPVPITFGQIRQILRPKRSSPSLWLFRHVPSLFAGRAKPVSMVRGEAFYAPHPVPKPLPHPPNLTPPCDDLTSISPPPPVDASRAPTAGLRTGGGGGSRPPCISNECCRSPSTQFREVSAWGASWPLVPPYFSLRRGGRRLRLMTCGHLPCATPHLSLSSLSGHDQGTVERDVGWCGGGEGAGRRRPHPNPASRTN